MIVPSDAAAAALPRPVRSRSRSLPQKRRENSVPAIQANTTKANQNSLGSGALGAEVAAR